MRDPQFCQLRDDDFDLLMVAHWTQRIENEVYEHVESSIGHAQNTGRDRQFLVGALVPLAAAFRDICDALGADALEAFSEIADRFNDSHPVNRKKANG